MTILNTAYLNKYPQTSINIIALGDSWFFYPENNILHALDHSKQYNIFPLGKNGARADGMRNYLSELKSFLETYRTIKAVLISAGGNDFAGLGDLDKIILNPICSSANDINSCYQPGQPDRLFEKTMKHYQEILDTIIKYGRLFGGHITVFVHNYDYPIPDGKALKIGNFTIGPWLKEPMDICKVPDDANPAGGFRYQLCVDLINRFTQKLESLAEKYQDNSIIRIKLIRSAGTLLPTEWANELHPNPGGFRKIVKNCWKHHVEKVFNLQ